MKRGTWVLGVGALIAAGATAAPAGAVDNWGPTNAYYKNNLVATGSGYFSNDRGQYAANRIKVTDRRNDGNTVYGKTQFQFLELCSPNSTAATWCNDRELSTPETTGTVEVWLRRPLHPQAEKARGVSRACAQLGWPVPDACSPAAYVTFSY
jgi:hypothetical protein